MARISGALTSEYKRARDVTRKRRDEQARLRRTHELALESAKSEDALELQDRRSASALAQQKEASAGALAVSQERSRGDAAAKGIASPTDLAQIPGMKAESEAASIVLNREKRRLAEEQFAEDAAKRAAAETVGEKSAAVTSKAITSLKTPLTTAAGKPKYVSGIAQTLKTMLAQSSKKKREDFKKRFSLFPNNLQ
jgi:DNA-binding helix-hairpin-helix protein with protein kinase domain